MCKIVFHSLLNFAHITQDFFVPNPNDVSYRPNIACITSIVGYRFGPPKNFGAAPAMLWPEN